MKMDCQWKLKLSNYRTKHSCNPTPTLHPPPQKKKKKKKKSLCHRMGFPVMSLYLLYRLNFTHTYILSIRIHDGPTMCPYYKRQTKPTCDLDILNIRFIVVTKSHLPQRTDLHTGTYIFNKIRTGTFLSHQPDFRSNFGLCTGMSI